MVRAHRFLGKALATFLVVFQGVATSYIAGAHTDRLTGATATMVATGDAGGGAVQHSDWTCTLCLLANAHAQHAGTPQVTSAPAAPAAPHDVMKVTNHRAHRPHLDASPRAPPTLHV